MAFLSILMPQADTMIDSILPHLSGEKNGCVIVLCIPVTGRVVLLLPAAEVPQGESSIGGNLWPLLLFIYN